METKISPEKAKIKRAARIITGIALRILNKDTVRRETAATNSGGRQADAK